MSPHHNGYRGVGANTGVGSGGTGNDLCIPCYSNGVESRGWLGSSGIAEYRDNNQKCTPSSRYAADVQQELALAQIVACTSLNQPLACPPSQDVGVGQWPGNITHGRPSGGWDRINALERIIRGKYLRNAPPRFSGSNRSGHATNTFGRITKSTFSGVNFPPSPINTPLYHLHGPSRNRFRRSDRSLMHSKERFGESEAVVITTTRRISTAPIVPAALTCAHPCGALPPFGVCDPVCVVLAGPAEDMLLVAMAAGVVLGEMTSSPQDMPESFKTTVLGKGAT